MPNNPGYRRSKQLTETLNRIREASTELHVLCLEADGLMDEMGSMKADTWQMRAAAESLQGLAERLR